MRTLTIPVPRDQLSLAQRLQCRAPNRSVRVLFQPALILAFPQCNASIHMMPEPFVFELFCLPIDLLAITIAQLHST
jgi:hypothetical protein